MTLPRTIFAPLAALAIAFAPAASQAHAQSPFGGGYQAPAPTTDAAPELEGVTILDKLDSQLPLDATFVDDNGKTIAFRDVLPKDRPIILQLGYLKCPMLCSLVMNALVRGLNGVDWTAVRAVAMGIVSGRGGDSSEWPGESRGRCRACGHRAVIGAGCVMSESSTARRRPRSSWANSRNDP